jgi:uncharacterized protein YfaS (alpha-2-macroglobulin family)
MRLRTFALLLAPLVFVAPAQEDEGRVSFAVSTAGPVRPGQKAIVHLQAQGVKALEFRLYRVKDAERFFRQLNDPHVFPANAKKLPERTPLERFASWKSRWHTRLRNLARLQFNGDNRARIRQHIQVEQEAKAPASKKAPQYAGLPLLNPQQLVKRWTERVRTKNAWDTMDVPLEVAEKGLYVIEVTNQKKQAYTILSVTDLAVITKASAGRIALRVVEQASGAGVADATVVAYDGASRADIVTAKTRANGTLDFKPPEDEDSSVVMLVRRGADFAVATLASYNYGAMRHASMTGYIYTDRPVYRPGHKVHFRAILRTEQGSQYRLPEESKVQVSIDDGAGKSVLKKSFSLSKYGTLAGDLDLPADAALGNYSVSVGGEEPMGAGAYGSFQVEEYRKPEYEVRVVPDVRRLVQGGSTRLTVSARYYYGEPVASAKVTYTVHRYLYYPPWWEVEELSDEANADEFGYGGEQVSEQTGTLDADGKLSVQIPVEHGPHDFVYRVQANVTDSGGRAIPGSGTFIATRSTFLISARPEKWVYAPQESVRLLVTTADYDKRPVGGIPFRFEVVPHVWKGAPKPAVYSGAGTTGADGSTSVQFPAPAAGSYHVKLSATRPEGGTLDEEAWLWVSGHYTDTTVEQTVRIVPDKSSYKVGDTARVLVAPGVDSCDAWVTVEGKELFWSKTLRIEGGSVTVDVPIEARFEPNIFFGVSFISNGELHQSTKLMKVPPVEKTIQVGLESSKPEFKPGEPATYRLTAKDSRGNPVRGQFSLGIVDEAIYAIQKEAQPDIVNAFYGRTWNRVSTESSLDYFFLGMAGKRRMELARAKRGETRAQFKPDPPNGPKVRKNFPDTAYWSAELETDSAGRAEVQMSFPDSLTTWRATARGVTVDTKVGGAVQRAIVRKNVLVNIATPRFFTEGDETVLPVLVRNYTNQEQKVKLSLKTSGIQIVSGADSEIRVAARGEGRLDYRVKATEPGTAVLTAKALADIESDALELSLPVEPYGLKRTQAEQRRLDERASAHEFSFTFPPDATPRARAVTVHLTPSVAGAVFGALDYLITYPYGCTEQTMSSFLPNVVVARALSELNLPSNVSQRELARKVNAGLERLYLFHHEDGGWGWWQDDKSDPFMTAYVHAGLRLAEQAGYTVRGNMLNSSRDWLLKRLAAPGEVALDTRAYMAYALSLDGRPQKSETTALWEARGKLTSFGLASLGLAYKNWNDPRATQTADELIGRVHQSGADTHWESNRDPMLDFERDNSFEATAFAIKLLAQTRPDSQLIDSAAQWLLNHRDQGYYWSSTKRTAFVVFGLTDVLRRSGELRPDYKARVTVNGVEALSAKFTAADALKPEATKIRIPIQGSSVKVRVERAGTGRLYASVNWEYRSTGETRGEHAAPEANGVRIEREYQLLKPVSSGGTMEYALEPLSGPVAPGTVIAVHVSVRGSSDERYFLMEDPIPSGAELIAKDDVFSIRGRPGWWRYWWERREARDSRMLYFPWNVPKGGIDYVYLLRVTNAGVFHVAPARIEPMYLPGTVSWTAPFTLEVKP